MLLYAPTIFTATYKIKYGMATCIRNKTAMNRPWWCIFIGFELYKRAASCFQSQQIILSQE